MTGADSTTAVLETVATLPPSEWLPDPAAATARILSEGTYHTCVLVESRRVASVARICRASQWGLAPRDQLYREFSVLRDLERTGVTPRPLSFVDGTAPMLFESFVAGSPFRYDDLDATARAIAACHREPVVHADPALDRRSPTEFLLADAAPRIELAGRCADTAVAAALLRRTLATLEARSPARGTGRTCIVHTDLIHTNLVATQRGCAILDWEGARIGPPEWDLAYFLSPVTLRWAPAGTALPTGSRRDAFLAAYASEMDCDTAALRDAVAELLPFVILRALAWCAGHAATCRATNATADPRLDSFIDPEFMALVLGGAWDVTA